LAIITTTIMIANITERPVVVAIRGGFLRDACKHISDVLNKACHSRSIGNGKTIRGISDNHVEENR
jgi:hypothetical protein